MEETTIRVEQIGNYREAIPQIATWLHNEWGELMPDISYPKLVSIFQERISPQQIPQAFVALAGEQIVGTASIVQHDMSTRLDLTPWMAAVYVIPEFRDKGVGSTLVRAVMEETHIMELPELYLMTPNRTSFYGRLGWQEFDKTAYRGENITIMIYKTERSS